DTAADRGKPIDRRLNALAGMDHGRAALVLRSGSAVLDRPRRSKDGELGVVVVNAAGRGFVEELEVRGVGACCGRPVVADMKLAAGWIGVEPDQHARLEQ